MGNMYILRAFAAEVLFNFWGAVTQLPFLALGLGGFLAIVLLGGHQLLPDGVASRSLMDSFWVFAFFLLGTAGPVRLLEEHRLGGTLEQLFLSPAPVWVLGFLRSVTNLITFSPALLLAHVGLRLAGQPPLDVTPSRLVLGLLVFLGALGIGYLVGALAYLGPHAGRALGLVLMAMLALSVVQPPSRGIGSALFSILLPTAATRRLGVLDRPEFWTGPGVAGLGVLSLAYLLVGLTVFRLAERQALRRGTVVRYYQL